MAKVRVVAKTSVSISSSKSISSSISISVIPQAVRSIVRLSLSFPLDYLVHNWCCCSSWVARVARVAKSRVGEPSVVRTGVAWASVGVAGEAIAKAGIADEVWVSLSTGRSSKEDCGLNIKIWGSRYIVRQHVSVLTRTLFILD